VRRPGLEPGAVSLEARCAVPLRQRRLRGPSGVRTLDERGLKVRRSTTELTARRYQRQGLFTGHRPFLPAGRAGLEPARLLLIRQAPSPAWPPPRSESQHRTDDLRVMGPALWPTELSRHGWPPRSRTARYLLIRQAPSTGWVAASGCGRSRTCKAEARPGSGRVPSPGRIAHP
jgi:hypothetical protein